MVNAQPPVSHRDIIDRAGGPAATSKSIAEHAAADSLSPPDANTTKAWKRTDSIPAPYYRAFAAAGLATLEELAQGAASRRAAAAA